MTTKLLTLKEYMADYSAGFTNRSLVDKAYVDRTGSHSFVFQPGGTASKNVYTSWPLLYADLSAAKGFRDLLFDKTFSAITIPLTLGMDFTGVRLRALPHSGFPSGTAATVVNFADGCTMTGLEDVSDNLTLRCSNTLVPLFSIDTKTTTQKLLKIRNGAGILAIGAQPFLDISASTPSGSFGIDVDNAHIQGNGTVHISSTNAALTVRLYNNAILQGSTIFTDVAGADGISFEFYSPSIQFTTPTGLNTASGIVNNNFMADMNPTMREASTLSTNPYVINVTNGDGDYRIDYDASTGPGAVTLPLNNAGQWYIIKKHWLDTTNNPVQINPTGGALIDKSSFVTISEPGEEIMVMSTGGASWDIINRYAAVTQQVVEVSKNGNDANGNGSVDSPFLTIQAAINSITPSNSIRYTINIAPGIYVETVTLKPFITLYGAPDTVTIQNDTGAAVIAPTAMALFGCDLVNINVINAGTGIACWIQDQGSIAFVGGSVSANDDDGLLVEGSGFILASNEAGFFSNLKNGANIKDTAIGIFFQSIFYSGDITSTYFDLNMAAGTIFKYTNDNDFQGNGANIASFLQIPVSKAKYEFYDNTISGLTAINVQDAIDELATLVAGPFTSTVSTTDATLTTLQTIPTTSNSCIIVNTKIIGRRTGGSSGSAQDAGAYERILRIKNVAGTVTIYDLQTDYTSEDQSAWDVSFSVSGTDVLAQVTGAVNNNIDWKAITERETV